MVDFNKKNGNVLLVLTWFMTILFLLQTVSAASVEKIKVYDVLNEDLSINEVMNVVLVNNTRDFISFSLPRSAFEIFLNDTPKKLNGNSLKVPLSCSSCEIKISYKLSKAVKKMSSDKFIFSRTLNFPQKIGLVDYSVKIPPGFIVGSQNSSNEPSIVPTPKTIETDGESIIVVWSEVNPELPKRYFVEYHTHEKLETNLSEFKNELTEWVVWLIVLISFILGMFVGKFFWKSKVKPSEPISHVPSYLLSLDEKTILDLLKENKNEMNQKEIGKQLDWSKSKVSAIMTNLQYKKIIVREKFGRNYKVKVVKEIQ